MKSENKLRVLEFIMEFGGDLLDLSFAFVTSPYGSSEGMIYKRLGEIQSQRIKNGKLKNNQIPTISKDAFNKLIYRLKKDGLVNVNNEEKRGIVSITNKGKEILNQLRIDKKDSFPSHKYVSEVDKNIKIIIFDIPEKERLKRKWLNFALKSLGLVRLQKSVWVGKVKIPEEFMTALHDLALLKFIEIFSIDKTGSLKQFSN